MSAKCQTTGSRADRSLDPACQITGREGGYRHLGANMTLLFSKRFDKDVWGSSPLTSYLHLHLGTQ